jgi:hypothetical protein
VDEKANKAFDFTVAAGDIYTIQDWFQCHWDWQ